MKIIPDEFKVAADRFFTALKSFDADAKLVENSAPVVATPPVATPDPVAVPPVTDEKNEVKTAEVTPPVAVPAIDEVAELKAKVTDLTAKLASMQVNLNSTMSGNADLIEKLSVIMNAPKKGEIVEVKNSRPADVKEDFKGWDEVINAKLGIKA